MTRRNSDINPASDLPKPRVKNCTLASAIRELSATLDHVGREKLPAAALLAGLDRVLAHVHKHIDMAESPGGLLHYVEQRRPRLLRSARRLRREHEQMLDELVRMEKTLSRCIRGTAGQPAFQRTCESARQFVELMKTHQQRGAGLVFEAYASDLGAGE